MSPYDLICVGGGPTGLATAIEAKRAGLRALVIEKGNICNSIQHYPRNMVFFTTPELLEIGGLPLTSASEKPTRVEALKYYRKAAEHYELEMRLFETVVRVEGTEGHFRVLTRDQYGGAQLFRREHRGGDGLLRFAELAGSAGRGFAERLALLHGAARILESGQIEEHTS